MRREKEVDRQTTIRKRNHLPHIDVPGGLYFVT